MSWIAEIKPGTVIEFENYAQLRAAWPHFRAAALGLLIARFRVKKPLTDAQLRRLPAALRDLVDLDDAVSWLERLHRLEDPREGGD